VAVDVFISFDNEDAAAVDGFRSISSNPNHKLHFNDNSLKEPVTDAAGRPIRALPDDPKSEPVKQEIEKMMQDSTRLIVLVGKDTHSSEWVKWEIEKFHGMKAAEGEQNGARRILVMRLKGEESASLPPELETKACKTIGWDPDEVHRWLEETV